MFDRASLARILSAEGHEVRSGLLCTESGFAYLCAEVDERSVRRWRAANKTPRTVVLGRGRIWYELDDVARWFNEGGLRAAKKSLGNVRDCPGSVLPVESARVSDAAGNSKKETRCK